MHFNILFTFFYKNNIKKFWRIKKSTYICTPIRKRI